MKTYKNDSYTRTVEIIKTSKKCLEYGYTCNVKVTTIWNDVFSIRDGATTTTEERYMTTGNYLHYQSLGYKYYTKHK